MGGCGGCFAAAAAAVERAAVAASCAAVGGCGPCFGAAASVDVAASSTTARGRRRGVAAAVAGGGGGFGAASAITSGSATGTATRVLLELRELPRQSLKRFTLRAGLRIGGSGGRNRWAAMLARIGIPGAAWLTSVRLALVHCWQVNSPPRHGDAGWQGKLRCYAGLIHRDRDTGLCCTPISKQGYLALRWALIDSCHRTVLADHGSADRLRDMAIRSGCCGTGLVTRRRSRGRRRGSTRGKQRQYEPHDQRDASNKRYPYRYISAGAS